MGFSDEEKANILKIYFRVNNYRQTRNHYRTEYPNLVPPSTSAIYYIVKNFENRKNVTRKKRTVARNEEKDLEILLYFEGNFKVILFYNEIKIKVLFL